jgi:aryl-alcohol dehydrogenase-like predicted oxidoreductase
MEQPQYNLCHRKNVEYSLRHLYSEIGLGLTTWSPLASGLLTGKYANTIPQGSRVSLKGYEWLEDRWSKKERTGLVPQFCRIAEELECTPAQLAIAWCLKNQNVSTVILGASSVAQLQENLHAASLKDKIDGEIAKRIDSIFDETEAI